MAGFVIRSSTLRIGIVISTAIICIIMVFQLIWFRNVYRAQQKEFDHSVIKALRGLYEDLDIKVYDTAPLSELIERPTRDLFIARANHELGTDSLTRFLQYELEDFEVFTVCHVGLYDKNQNRYIYKTVLEPPGERKNPVADVPGLQRPFDCIVLSFPNRERFILSQMNFWIITSAVLLLVLILLSGSLYYFYKQKFLNETQRDFIHNFTHEFKTPVAVMGLAAEVLEDPAIVNKPEKLSVYAGIVKYQSGYLHSQIDRLLQFAYTDSRHIHLRKEVVNLHSLVEEAVANLEPLIAERSAVLGYELNAPSPFLQADRGYLLIVIINLIENAIKYSREPEILLQSSKTEKYITLAVKDNGIGMDKKQVRQIFKRFYRGQQGETHSSKGFGIGLAFVKKIMSAHNGKIRVESEPGRGSRFIIQLPIS